MFDRVEQLVVFFGICFARNTNEAPRWSSHPAIPTSSSASSSTLPFNDPDLQGKTIMVSKTSSFVKCVMEWREMVVGESPVSVNSLAGLPSSLNDQITFSETLKIFNGRG